MTRSEAFRWLQARSGQTFSNRRLAREWRVPRTTLRGWLDHWESGRRITRRRVSNDGTIITCMDRRPAPQTTPPSGEVPQRLRIDVTVTPHPTGGSRAFGMVGDLQLVLTGSKDQLLAGLGNVIDTALQLTWEDQED